MAIIVVSSVLLVSLGGGGGGEEYAFAQNINLTLVSSISNGDDSVGTFNILDAPIGTTTVTIGESLYALITSSNDDSVQIIDITNPKTPIIVSSITDGDVDGNGDTFDQLDGAYSIITVTIGSSIYALVGTVPDTFSSASSGGIQIINITDPAAPTAVTSLNRNSDPSFDTLNGVNDIAIVEIDGSTYAVATSAGVFTKTPGIQIINISNPAAPYLISSITPDINNGFDELDNPKGVTIVEISGSTYALVANKSGDGVQIINISNPAMPIATSSVTDATADNGSTFDTLDGASDIATVTVGSSTYALVTANKDDGIQIIDISNPADPTVVTSIADGDADDNGVRYDRLLGANKISTVSMGSSTYALVTSIRDQSVQIINITDPTAPTAASQVTSIELLADANDIAIVTVGSSTYAIVTATLADAVNIINITDPANPKKETIISDNAVTFDALGGPIDVTTVTIGGFTYALVASSAPAGGGVQIINITDPTAPSAVSSIADGDPDGSGGTFDELDGARSITTVKIGSLTYALVASIRDDGVQIINISDPASPLYTSSVTDGGSDGASGTFDKLDGARDITTVTIGDSTYALVTGFKDNGIQIIDISNPANPTAVESIADGTGSFDTLNQARNVTTVEINGSTYALVAASGDTDNGIQIINISDPAVPAAVTSITDDTGNFSTLGGARSITTVKIGDLTYALVTANTDNGIQIINITDPTNPIATFSISDDDDTFVGTNVNGSLDPSQPAKADGDTFDTLAGANGITTVEFDGSIYALVTSNIDNGIQAINITDPANPTAAFSVGANDTFTPTGASGAATSAAASGAATLAGANGITTVKIDGSTYVVAAANGANGVQIFRIDGSALELTLNITQTLPTITFSDGTEDIVIDENGVGSLEFASLVDTLVTTENLDNTNVIQFTLDPEGPYNDRNPAASSSMADETPFQLAGFQSDQHTVIYNKTHFIFNFDDPKFTGTTPPVSFQVAIHTALDMFPIIHSDIGTIIFNIEPPLLCEMTVGNVSLDFGSLEIGMESTDGTIVIDNSGNMNNDVKIGADHWCLPNGCVVNDALTISPMVNSQTRFAMTANTVYADKDAFTNFEYDIRGPTPTREGHPTDPFTTVDLFSLIIGTNSTGTAYLQVEVALRDVAGIEQNRFTGSTAQEIILESDCNTS